MNAIEQVNAATACPPCPTMYSFLARMHAQNLMDSLRLTFNELVAVLVLNSQDFLDYFYGATSFVKVKQAIEVNFKFFSCPKLHTKALLSWYLACLFKHLFLQNPVNATLNFLLKSV